MASWFALIVGTWLFLSVLVSLGLARAINLSNRTPRPMHPYVVLESAAVPAIPIQRQVESSRQYRQPVTALSR